MKLNYFTIFIFIPALSLANINQKDCHQNFDYSDRYPAVRDQDGHGLCWSFAAAALYEEALCLESKKNPKLNYKCGQRISVLDMARCNFALGSGYSEGGFSESALNCVLANKANYLKIKPINDQSANILTVSKEHRPGVCLESKAPFYSLRSGLSGIYDEFFKGVYDPSSLHYYLVDIYKECSDCKTRPKNNSTLDDSIEILKTMLPKQEKYGVDFKKALTSGLSNEDFLRQILITPRCEEARLSLEKIYKVDFQDFLGATIVKTTYSNGKSVSKSYKQPDATTAQKFKSLKKSLAKGTSVQASICYGKYKSERQNSFLASLFGESSGLVTEDDCGGHAIVIAGLRWNSNKNQCETFVRNSWGSGASLNGWVKAENILDVTNSFSQMVKK